MASGKPGLIARRVQAWARRRQGSDPQSLRLLPRRVYVLPTRSGLVFGLVVLTMLIGSLNYSNNMGFALTFFLAAIAIVSLYICHRNLAGVQVSLVAAPPVHAGDRLHCVIGLANDSRRTRYQIMVGPEAVAQSVDLAPGMGSTVALPAATRRRGLAPMPPLEVSTAFPLGLFRAWTWLNFARPLLVYPAPAEQLLSARQLAGEDQRERLHEGSQQQGDEFSGLRSYLPGESPGRIAWKVLARTGELMSRDFRGNAEPVWLDWQALPGDTEQRISLITRMALDLSSRGETWGLRLPGQEIRPDAGADHLHRCLQTLAVLPG